MSIQKVLLSASPEKAKNIQRTMQFLQNEIDKNPHDFIGPFYNSLDELPTPYKVDIYPLLYGAFNSAVHPNLKLLSGLVRQKDNKRTFQSDLEDVRVQDLKIYGMTAAFNILVITRIHYEWDYKGMKSEYLAIKKELVG